MIAKLSILDPNVTNVQMAFLITALILTTVQYVLVSTIKLNNSFPGQNSSEIMVFSIMKTLLFQTQHYLFVPNYDIHV